MEEFYQVLGDRYGYELVPDVFKGVDKIPIICREEGHGVFYTRPGNHRSGGGGCPKCAGQYQRNREERIEHFQQVHRDRNFDYSLLPEDIDSQSTITVICEKHGEFTIVATNHAQGAGCSDCKASRGERTIFNLLEGWGIWFETQRQFEGCVYKGQLKFDFYLPGHNMCIEYNGKQHYEPIDFYGGEESLRYNQIRDQVKRDFCAENDIYLLEIPYTERKNIEEILSNVLFG